MPNRLARETSPYLRQHAHNPVDWHPWGPEALALAQSQDRPIFLSIGYSTCHWCHVMAHESFEDPATATLMNEHFINIKVDREERPDLDALYMQAVVAMTGQGGWPMSVFLTPLGEPFFGGTYFPPIERHGLPAFRQVLLTVANAWESDRERMQSSATRLTEHLRQSFAAGTGASSPQETVLDRAAELLSRDYDWTHGGWGSAPKFPPSQAIEFLLRRHDRTREALALDMAKHALESMARGGIFDHVGGGFHRYTTDSHWLVPHFEKTLVDNALLAATYLHAWLVTGEPAFRRVSESTLDFMLREMRLPEGGLASALDADSEGEEGRFYLWSLGEVAHALGDAELADLFSAAFGLTQAGSFEGRGILHRALDDQALTQRFHLSPPNLQDRLDAARSALLIARSGRVRPATDDKVVAEWNGLAISALAEAARALARADYLEAAQAVAGFVLPQMGGDGRLMRTWREGQARNPGCLADHATLASGLLSLYQTDFNPRWFEAAARLAGQILDRFVDPQGGFFDTPDDANELVARPRSVADSGSPSGTSMAAELLLRMSALTGDDRYAAAAGPAILTWQETIGNHPTAYAGLLNAFDFMTGPQTQLAIAGDPGDARFQALAAVAARRYLPRTVVAGGNPANPAAPRLLSGRHPESLEPTAYLCQGFACRLPTTSPETLRGQLEEMTQSNRP